MRVRALVFLFLAGIVSCDEVKSYRGHHVLSTKADTETQLAVLRQLQNEYHEVMFLREPSTMLATDLVVPGDQKDQVITALENAGLSVTIQSSDLQAQIDEEKKQNDINKLRYGGVTEKNGSIHLSHKVYYTVETVNQILFEFERSYPHLVRVKVMDKVTEEYGYPVFYLKMGTARDNKGSGNKPVIFIESLTHSREWITTASVLYSVDMMLRGYNQGDSEMKRLLTDFTWVITPMVNPDGYHYTWTRDRLWRKNRRFIGANCRGVDLNRNYDVDFRNTGVSTQCRDEIYPGEEPFSETETQNVRNLFKRFKSRIVAFLSVHAYSQLLLYPWGYISSNNPHKEPDNLEKLIKVGNHMKSALQSVDGRRFLLGTAYGVLGYAASGAAEDWALQEKPGIYSYCYELRPSYYTPGGFIIDPSNIIPSGEELLRSLLVLSWEISVDIASGQ